MIRKPTALGQSLVAILALAAIGTSSAQAGALDVGTSPAVLKGHARRAAINTTDS